MIDFCDFFLSLFFFFVPTRCTVIPAALSWLIIRPVNAKANFRVQCALAYPVFLSYMAYIYFQGTRIILSGDVDPPHHENAFVISNHVASTDPWFIFSAAFRANRIPGFRTFVKDMLKYAGPWGAWGWFAGFVTLKRDWNADKKRMNATFADMKARPTVPGWLLAFIEGTRITPKKYAASEAFAKERGLPSLTHLMQPRTKGFTTTLLAASEVFDAVYDVTLGYPKGYPTPQLPQFLNGNYTPVVHLHLKRYDIDELPVDDEEALKAWAFARWQEKDKMLDYFHKHGGFPVDHTGTALAPQSENTSWWPLIGNFLSVFEKRHVRSKPVTNKTTKSGAAPLVNAMRNASVRAGPIPTDGMRRRPL